MTIDYPPHIPLAHLPTPLTPLSRMGRELGLTLHIKRDDLTGSALSGNKVRKLEFVLAEARALGADTVLTCGGAQSNHCRATAVAAARMGLKCRLILRTENPDQPPSPQGNVLLDRLAGAEIFWITPDEYRQVGTIFEREADRLKTGGHRPYIIPEGASNALGAWGYIRAAQELRSDWQRLGHGAHLKPTIVIATGSGGTAAGLILGTKLLDRFARVVCVNVCDDETYFRARIGEICEAAIERFNLGIGLDRTVDIEIIDGYVGAGYALSRPAELALIRDVARKEGIFLDPVYTGKAFYGMVSELKRDSRCFGEHIVFIHTGGIFGLFPKAGELAPLL